MWAVNSCQVLQEVELDYQMSRRALPGAWFYSLWMLAIDGITWCQGQFLGVTV